MVKRVGRTNKGLARLTDDFKNVLDGALQIAAANIVEDLQKAGPYWTGFFSEVWEVKAGDTPVVANLTDPFPVRLNQPRSRPTSFPRIDVPPTPNLAGYTIGNRARYRLYAMDILPSKSGRGAYPAANLTADKNWFDRYVNTQLQRTLDRYISGAFRATNLSDTADPFKKFK